MKQMRVYCLFFALYVLTSSDATTQGTSPFDLPGYRAFLQTTQNLSTEGLLALHPAGIFKSQAHAAFSTASYFDSMNNRYHFTPYELELLQRHSFVVTERLRRESFGEAFIELYHADLPVFVSSDAILHALHKSYDDILKHVEVTLLYHTLDTLLERLHARVSDLHNRYGQISAMTAPLRDVDVYFTVARKLLDSSAIPVFPENTGEINALLQLIDREAMGSYPLFSTTPRYIDFSQFTVRGHYTDVNYPQLARYFRSMIWLGRTELYLVGPQNIEPLQTEEDIQRQVIDAVLIAEAADLADAYELVGEIDGILRFFVGESDNVTLPNIRTIIDMTGTDSATSLLNTARLHAFQDTLRQQAYAFQRINSQILISDPTSPDSAAPASSFLLLGQRFVIDSYTTGAVVYDKIRYNGSKVLRMLPKTLDILFAIGNDASAQLLQDELNAYHYAPNLAAVRYLVDSYDADFWHGSLYNAWLNAIRQLRPPAQCATLPPFMQTAAWWQEKMNTQLASWSQLRHDNLLYAKQSYTGGTTCSYPESYVEPVPEFYDAVRAYAELGETRFGEPPFEDSWLTRYFGTLKNVADTLKGIAQKELSETPLAESERSFLRRMLYSLNICGTVYDGWYPRLFFSGESSLEERDYTVADVHTAPTDAFGSPVGWVLHGGTGPINLGVWITDKPDGGPHAYIGPVMSYYEHVSVNFHRLTDEEWVTAYELPPSFRPSFVNLYLADTTGNSRGQGATLLTGIPGGEGPQPYPETPALKQNYPNPFNPTTFIAFTVPLSYENSYVTLNIFDLLGNTVATLVGTTMPAGNYVVRWTGTNNSGLPVASGMYLYQLRVGGFTDLKKLMLVR